MANVNKVKVSPSVIKFTNAITGKNEVRTVVFSMWSLACLEEEVGSIDDFMAKLSDSTTFKFKDIATLAYASLCHYDDFTSPKSVASIIELSELQSIMPVLVEQLTKSMPQSDESKN